MTRYDRTSITSTLAENVEQIAKELNTTLFESTIRQGVAIRESQLLQSDIFTESPKSKVALEYSSFVDEVIQRISERS